MAALQLGFRSKGIFPLEGWSCLQTCFYFVTGKQDKTCKQRKFIGNSDTILCFLLTSVSRPTACRISIILPYPLRCSYRETTAQEPSASSRLSSPQNLSRGYVRDTVVVDLMSEIRQHREVSYESWKIILTFVCLQLDKQQFEETIQTLNNLYAEAEKLGGKSYLEGCLACLTAYTVFLCMETHYEKVSPLQLYAAQQLADKV